MSQCCTGQTGRGEGGEREGRMERRGRGEGGEREGRGRREGGERGREGGEREERGRGEWREIWRGVGLPLEHWEQK